MFVRRPPKVRFRPPLGLVRSTELGRNLPMRAQGEAMVGPLPGTDRSIVATIVVPSTGPSANRPARSADFPDRSANRTNTIPGRPPDQPSHACIGCDDESFRRNQAAPLYTRRGRPTHRVVTRSPDRPSKGSPKWRIARPPDRPTDFRPRSVRRIRRLPNSRPYRPLPEKHSRIRSERVLHAFVDFQSHLADVGQTSAELGHIRSNPSPKWPSSAKPGQLRSNSPKFRPDLGRTRHLAGRRGDISQRHPK